MRKERGFTLLELLITLSIAAMLATIAVPSFKASVQHNRSVAATNELYTALNYARQTAIIRNSHVALCKSTDGKRCNHALPDWNSG